MRSNALIANSSFIIYSPGIPCRVGYLIVTDLQEIEKLILFIEFWILRFALIFLFDDFTSLISTFLN